MAQNSAFPIAAALFNKALDLAFAIVALRVLGPGDAGKYAFVGVIAIYLDILLGFGMNTWLTREAARHPARWRPELWRVLRARALLWLLLAALAGAGGGALATLGTISAAEVLALALLVLALAPNGAAAALSAVFQAFERMEYPAAVTVQTTLLKVALGLLALALGFGFVGLAAVAIVVNVLTLLTLLALFQSVARPATASRSTGSIGGLLDLLRETSPFMVNNLLASLFFRVDLFLLRPIAGDTAAGWYSAAYRVVDGLTLIPAYFTLALFPDLARRATTDRAALARVYGRALKALLTLALPVSVGIWLLAEPLVELFAGRAYLPQSAWALAVLIWFLPFSYVNGVTQYVLIALDRQRFLTAAFLLATVVNFGANLLLIPRFGLLAAAALTVASELVLLGPFWWATTRELPGLSVLRLAWRPAAAAAAMGAVIAPLAQGPWLLAVPVGAAVYGGVLLALGGVDADDRALLRRLRAPT
ncbi:MAG: oligosaccharide flippase family protein [Chloroflexi bacterium]|nr:oligosaccharide flippase family protein [Chloroflexota bacterium]